MDAESAADYLWIGMVILALLLMYKNRQKKKQLEKEQELEEIENED